MDIKPGCTMEIKKMNNGSCVIYATIEEIHQHEVCLLRNTLRKMGVFDKYLNERMSRFHYVYSKKSPFTLKTTWISKSRWYKEWEKEMMDALKYMANKYQALYPGILVEHFNQISISFPWQDTVEGSVFWSVVHESNSHKLDMCQRKRRNVIYKIVSDDTTKDECR